MRAILLVLLLPVACARQPAPGAPPARAERAAQPAPTVDGAWSFSTGQGACLARVGRAAVALSIRATPGSISFQTLPAAGAGFAGTAGSWRMRRGELGAPMPMARALPRLRAVLGGGVVTLDPRAAGALRVPDAGIAGRGWLACLDTLQAD